MLMPARIDEIGAGLDRTRAVGAVGIDIARDQRRVRIGVGVALAEAAAAQQRLRIVRNAAAISAHDFRHRDAPLSDHGAGGGEQGAELLVIQVRLPADQFRLVRGQQVAYIARRQNGGVDLTVLSRARHGIE